MRYGMISTGSREASEAAKEILKLANEKKIFDSLKLIFKFNESSIICLMTCKGFFGMINEFTKLMSFLFGLDSMSGRTQFTS